MTAAPELDDLLDDAAQERFSGVVMLADDTRVLRAFSAGLASRPWSVPNQIDTRFRVASIGKMFTAVAVMQLWDRGLLDLDAPVLPSLELGPTALPEALTARHLLCMTGGIADWLEESEDVAAGWEALLRRVSLPHLRTHRDYLPLFAHTPPRAPPGAGHLYSNASYVLLGLLLERRTGLDYYELIRQRVFAPAGMGHSGFDAIDDPTPVAEGYVKVGEVWKRNIFHVTPTAGADGGAISTAGDLVRFARALRGGALCSAEATAALLTPWATDGDPFRGYTWMYGFGCQFLLDERGAVVRRGHTGEEDGASGRLWHYPHEGLDLVILSNHSGAAGPLGWRLHDRIVGRG